MFALAVAGSKLGGTGLEKEQIGHIQVALVSRTVGGGGGGVVDANVGHVGDDAVGVEDAYSYCCAAVRKGIGLVLVAFG